MLYCTLDMQHVIRRLRATSAPVFTVIAGGVGITLLMVFRLVSITNGQAAPAEVQTINLASGSFRALAQNHILDAPYLVPAGLVFRLTHSLFYTRLVSVAFGLLAVALVYYIVHKWHGYKVAALATLLFGCSSLLLHAARVVDPRILEPLVGLGLLALSAYSSRQQGSKQLLAWLIGAALMLYVGGAIWLVLLVVSLQWQRLVHCWRHSQPMLKAAGLTAFLLLVSPLVYYLVHSSHTVGLTAVWRWLGIATTEGQSFVASFAHTMVSVPTQLFWHGSASRDPEFWLGSLPAFGIATVVLIALGLYVYGARLRDWRWRTNLLLMAAGWLVIGLGLLHVLLLTPLLYLVAATGIAYLLHEWYSVFPRNPLARSGALILITVLVGLGALYGVRQYFVAWSHNVRTHTTFTCNLGATLPPPECVVTTIKH